MILQSTTELFAKLVSAGIMSLLGVGFVVAGVAMMRSGNETRRITNKRSEFEPVQAEILSSEIREVEDRDDPSSGWIPEVTYEYTVDGRRYTSDSVYPGEITGSGDESEERAIVEKYPPGARATAFYHPDDPTMAYLEDESTKGGATLVLGVGALFAAGGVGCVLGAASLILSLL